MAESISTNTVTNIRRHYIELMKNVLSFSLWPDPGMPLETFNLRYRRNFLMWALVATSVRVMSWAGLGVVRKTPSDAIAKAEGRIWPVLADTMIGLKRLDNLQFCIETALHDNVPGDLIETGVWRGGACIFMRAILMAYGISDRLVFVADSFAGLPEPDERQYPQDKRDKYFTLPFLAISMEEVKRNFQKYGLLDDQVVFLKGWFKDTLPAAPIEKLSLLRLDGDMYQSTMEVLTYLYPKLSAGGFCIIDDYALQGCKQAVDDFRNQNGITSMLHKIDWTGVYWRKGS